LAALEIVEDQYGIRGRHVEQDCQFQTLPAPLCTNARNGAMGYVSLDDYGRLMLDLAVAYRAADTEENRRVYREYFNRMVRHLIDQGWVAGSSLGTTHHFGYESQQWGKAIFLMRKPLVESGLLAPMADALAWFAREFADLVHPEKGCTRADDMDYLHTAAKTHLMLSLMRPNTAEQSELLRRFSRNMAATLANPKRDLGSGFKIDGTAFHHGGHYPAYSFGGSAGAAELAWLLRGTRFELPADARATIKRALVSAWIYGNPKIGLGLCGRHPFRTGE
jgi:chondroitin-sulfate-ABC endolyase/exolyase